MRRPRLALALLVTLAAVAGSVLGVGRSEEPTADALAIRYYDVGAPGPLGPITIFGDSVMYGSALYSPTLTDHLAAQGWGPIRFLAGAGFNTGRPQRAPDAARITYWIQRWRQEGWVTGPWVINLGANDSAFCSSQDSACMRATIEHVLGSLDPGTRVWWPQMTIQTRRAVEQFTWNTTLAQVAAARPELTTWDWPTVMRTGGFASSDNVHLSPAGYRTRSALMAREITAALARSSPSTAPPPALPAATGDPAALVTGVADRVLDTRSEPPGRLSPGTVHRVDLAGHVAPGTTAAALYVTAVDPTRGGYLTVAPCGERSDASTVNFRAFETRGAPTITKIGADRSVCVTMAGEADLVVDLQAAFHPTDTTGLRFDPLDVPTRLADTRDTGMTKRLVLNAPAGADAVAVNLTTVDSLDVGYVVAAPCDESPKWANLNFQPGPAIASSAIVEVGDDGTFCVETPHRTHMVVDVTGTFSDTGSLRLLPVVPTRVLDTRENMAWNGLHGDGQTIRFRVAPPSAQAVTGTITIVWPYWGAHLTGFGCVGAPPTSSVNTGEFAEAANSLTTGIDGGDLCVTASTATHTLFDTTGWWVAS